MMKFLPRAWRWLRNDPLIVQFGDKYAVRRRAGLLFGYVYRDLHDARYYWRRDSVLFPECLGTLDRAIAVRALAERGTPLDPQP